MRLVLNVPSIQLAVLLSLCAGIASAQEGEGVNPLSFNAARSHPPQYVSGQVIEIQLSFTANDPGQITAIGMRESVPVGWTYMGMRGFSGDPPSVAPQQGSTGLLEFAWISVPNMPYTFAYSLQVPPGDGGTKIIHGQPEYRTNAGRLFAAPVLTSLEGPPVDTTPPVIRLNGPNQMSLPLGTPYVEPGYTATDDRSGDLTAQVTVSGAVDSSRVGIYTLTYSVSDQAGNQADPVQRVVQVVSSTDGGGAIVNPPTGSVGRPRFTGGGTTNPGGARPRPRQSGGTTANTAATAAQRGSVQRGGADANLPVPTGDPNQSSEPFGVQPGAIGNVIARVASNMKDPGAAAGDSGAAASPEEAERTRVASLGGVAPMEPIRVKQGVPTAALMDRALASAPEQAEKPGVFARLREAAARDAAVLGVAGIMAAVLAILALTAGRFAYSGTRRR